AGIRESCMFGDVARRLQREHEAIRCLVAPFRIDRRLLRTIVGAVDLDCSEVAARVFELAPLRQAIRIERATPRRERPAADTGTDARIGRAQLRERIGDGWVGRFHPCLIRGPPAAAAAPVRNPDTAATESVAADARAIAA